MKESDSEEDYGEIYAQFMKNLELLQRKIEESPYTEFKLLELMTAVNVVLSKYLFVRRSLKDYDIAHVNAFINPLLQDMDQMGQSQILSLCSIKDDMKRLLEIVKQVKEWFADVNAGKNDKEATAALRKSLLIIRIEEKNKIRGYYNLLEDYRQEMAETKDYLGYLPMKQNDLMEIMKLGRTSITTSLVSTL